MALFDKLSNQYNGMPLDVLEKQLAGKMAFMKQLLAEQKTIKAELDLYSFEGYDAWKENVLGSECQRLMELRMTILPEEVNFHREAQAQYNQCVLLSRKKDHLEKELGIYRKKVNDTNATINRMSIQINKIVNKEKRNG